jgi:hypothetical protein
MAKVVFCPDHRKIFGMVVAYSPVGMLQETSFSELTSKHAPLHLCVRFRYLRTYRAVVLQHRI